MQDYLHLVSATAPGPSGSSPAQQDPSAPAANTFPMKLTRVAPLLLALHLAVPLVAQGGPAVKTHSALYGSAKLAAVRQNAARLPWGQALRDRVVELAQPWREMSDEQLWGLMFGPTITRSWMVWSNGHCPACEQSVPMYNWQIDALARPWKVRCPHCKQLFPKNDFAAFYQSGLDAQGVFDPQGADRTLLFNAEHPDPDDPLHLFGVDDGEGYVEGDKRWRFIGAYLIYGQWKQAVVGGILNLSAAYALTGEQVYAHKAAVLLDRVADLYGGFDYKRQAFTYEKQEAEGYVSVWHDACMETYELTRAYDMIFEGMEGDRELVAFLSQQAQHYGLANAKHSVAEIRRNIEDGLLREVQAHRPKIESNVPRTDMTLALIETVLGWPENREEVLTKVGKVVAMSTGADGVSGEKGLSAYQAFSVQGLATFLTEYERAEPGFLQALAARYPALRRTWRFHVDTWCLEKYYPSCGDGGNFAAAEPHYCGVVLNPPTAETLRRYPHANALAPSGYSFLWALHEMTGDPVYAQLLYRENGKRLDNLPWDLFCPRPARVRVALREVLKQHGEQIALDSVNLTQWHLAILRAGEGASARAAWLDYDTSGKHSHWDGLNLGLFAHGLDLLPDFGYPPVQYGGWDSPRSAWYSLTAAHNTVTVDGANQRGSKWRPEPIAGQVTLWARGPGVQVVRATGSDMYEIPQYERTVAMVDLSPDDFYLVDIFRVVGGTDHTKFTTGHFGTISAQGLQLREAAPFGYATQMRGLRVDPAAQPGWSAEWVVEDRHRLREPGAQVRVRYTDLTTGAQAGICEAWVAPGSFGRTEDAWVPRVMVRRLAAAPPLASTFVALLEPYEGQSNIQSLRRLPLLTEDGRPYPDGCVAVEITLTDGRRHLLVAADVENPLDLRPSLEADGVLVQPDWGVRLQGEVCLVRKDKTGQIESAGLHMGQNGK